MLPTSRKQSKLTGEINELFFWEIFPNFRKTLPEYQPSLQRSLIIRENFLTKTLFYPFFSRRKSLSNKKIPGTLWPNERVLRPTCQFFGCITVPWTQSHHSHDYNREYYAGIFTFWEIKVVDLVIRQAKCLFFYFQWIDASAIFKTFLRCCHLYILTPSITFASFVILVRKQTKTNLVVLHRFIDVTSSFNLII